MDKKIINYEDVKSQTTSEYFENNEFSIDAFNSKYTLYEGETYVQSLKRVCDHVASVEETEELQEYWSNRWFDEVYNDWWHPAGSIMQGAGSGRKISLANCTTISLGTGREEEEWDSLEGIIRNCAYTVAKTAAYRQGLGVDFSRLRPRGSTVQNSANYSTGAIHWMEYIDKIGYFVGQQGRIPAMLFSISCSHPDVEEFIGIKADYSKIQNANISVQCTDDFYKAVEKGDDWVLNFSVPEVKVGDKVYVDCHSTGIDRLEDDKGWYYIAKKEKKAELITKTVKARDLLKLIAQNMFTNAEPGIQNIDIARRLSNSDYVYDPSSVYDSRIVSTNACSEQYLSRESLCVLASANAARFSTIEAEYEEELSVIGPSINRFLDNVNECELRYSTYATPHQRLAIEHLRRTGAGFTNVAGWLFKLNEKYGSEIGNKAIATFAERYNYYLYKGSIALGREKGSFQAFNRKKLEESPFIQHMMEKGLKFTALRNVTCSSIAPTGTLSLMFRGFVMSYGIEPAFGVYFWKRTRMSGKYEYYFCVPRVVRDYFRLQGLEIPMISDTIKDTWDGEIGKPIVAFIDKHINDLGIKFAHPTEIKSMDKLDLMSQVMKDVDSSISVTYMLPEDTPIDDVYEFILESWRKGVKSIAAFPDKRMYGIISYMPFKELAVKLKEEGTHIDAQNFSDEELEQLHISKQNVILNTQNAPKRNAVLDAEIYSVVVGGEKFVIVIGLQNGYPYEIFGGHMNGFGIKNKKCAGKISKVARGKYALEFGDVIIEDFSMQFSPVEQLLFRSVSLMMRHGIPIEFIVEQLQKATDDISSLAAATCRVMKKYVSNGQKVSGKVCVECGSELLYHDGCVKCTHCTWSLCA